MRHILIVVLVLALIIAGDVGAYRYLKTTSASLNSEVKSMVDYISKGQWEQATASADALRREWGKRKSAWSILVDHKEIDEIEQSLIRAEYYIKTKNKSMSLAESKTLSSIIEHIPDNQLFSIENIL
ncbi:DUF4363 family protein [Caldanaerobius polysaccharolyticus]|uniref:DUF4363 family protein n=1 Tax=Caldanaerobius polysaccharolyticus TaxID=44256 RepID=UPI000478C072|nr:DUF4363 family protein [Caldanaerobius polysaccharolyticus]